MAPPAALELVEEETQLHADHQARHTQENVPPHLQQNPQIRFSSKRARNHISQSSKHDDFQEIAGCPPSIWLTGKIMAVHRRELSSFLAYLTSIWPTGILKPGKRGLAVVSTHPRSPPIPAQTHKIYKCDCTRFMEYNSRGLKKFHCLVSQVRLYLKDFTRAMRQAPRLQGAVALKHRSPNNHQSFFMVFIRTHEHVKVVEEVNGEARHLERELEVVNDDATVLPNTLVVQVVQVQRVTRQDVKCLQPQQQALKHNERCVICQILSLDDEQNGGSLSL